MWAYLPKQWYVKTTTTTKQTLTDHLNVTRHLKLQTFVSTYWNTDMSAFIRMIAHLELSINKQFQFCFWNKEVLENVKTRLKLSYNKDENNQTIFDRVTPLGKTQWHLFAVSLQELHSIKKIIYRFIRKIFGPIWFLVQSNNF